MAKKTKPQEEVIEEKEEKVNYDEVHNKDVDELLAAPIVEEKKEEVKEEEIKEEVKVEPKEEGVDFDPEKLKKEISEETTQKLVQALTGKDDKETQENKDEYEKFSQELWDKEGRAPTWTEALKFASEIVKRDLKAEKDAEVKAQEEQQKKTEEDQKQTQERINKFIDKEIDELYVEGKLPKIADKNDPNDAGVLARKELFKTMLEVNQRLVKEGKEPEYSPYKIFHKYYKSPSRQPAGADAPVSVGSNAVAGEESEKINYFRDVKKRSWMDILQGK